MIVFNYLQVRSTKRNPRHLWPTCQIVSSPTRSKARWNPGALFAKWILSHFPSQNRHARSSLMLSPIVSSREHFRESTTHWKSQNRDKAQNSQMPNPNLTSDHTLFGVPASTMSLTVSINRQYQNQSFKLQPRPSHPITKQARIQRTIAPNTGSKICSQPTQNAPRAGQINPWLASFLSQWRTSSRDLLEKRAAPRYPNAFLCVP